MARLLLTTTFIRNMGTLNVVEENVTLEGGLENGLVPLQKAMDTLVLVEATPLSPSQATSSAPCGRHYMVFLFPQHLALVLLPTDPDGDISVEHLCQDRC